MSQAANHVTWCLEKAKREIDEATKAGKRPKHRGLIKIKPDVNEAKKHIERAEYNLKVMQFMNDKKFLDWAVNAGFYSVYHCFLGILSKCGYESRNQTCTVAAIEYLKEQGKIEIDSEIIAALKHEESENEHGMKIISLREEHTYGVKITVKEKNITEIMELCKKAIDAAREIVFS